MGRRTHTAAIAATAALVLFAALAGAASAATKVTKYSPFAADGGLRKGLTSTRAFGGTCSTGSFIVSGASAYRCFSGDVIRDPCYLDKAASNADRSVVVCVESPWATAAVRLRVAGRLRHVYAAKPGGPPWAVRLASRSRCLWIAGASALIGGRRISYACGSGNLLLGAPDRGRATWQIQQVTGPTDRAPRRVAVAQAWH